MKICWPLNLVFGIGYVLSIFASRKLAMFLEQSKPKKGKVVEYPDELGLWWVEDE